MLLLPWDLMSMVGLSLFTHLPTLAMCGLPLSDMCSFSTLVSDVLSSSYMSYMICSLLYDPLFMVSVTFMYLLSSMM